MISKKHHYLSRFYIEGFSDHNGLVWTYRKENPNNPFSGSPQNIANENKLYNLDLAGLGEKFKVDDVENYLANKIENPVADAFKRLRNKIFPNIEEREYLSSFFGLLFARSPRQMKHLKALFDEDIQKNSSLLASNKEYYHNEYKKFDPNYLESEVEEGRQLILIGAIKFGAHQNFVLEKMIFSGLTIGILLNNMNWTILETIDTLPFVTSDSLINVSHPNIFPDNFYQPGFGMLDARVIIPISKNLCLLMMNNKDFENNSVQILDKTRLEETNKFIYSISTSFIFASSNSEELKNFLIGCHLDLKN